MLTLVSCRLFSSGMASPSGIHQFLFLNQNWFIKRACFNFLSSRFTACFYFCFQGLVLIAEWRLYFDGALLVTFTSILSSKSVSFHSLSYRSNYHQASLCMYQLIPSIFMFCCYQILHGGCHIQVAVLLSDGITSTSEPVLTFIRILGSNFDLINAC